MENNSGNGNLTIVSEEISKKFNWGACLLGWIWGIGNKTYITLLVSVVLWILGFVPVFRALSGLLGLGVAVWFGIKGNEWAWQNKKFESVEQFHSNQKKWAIAGIIWAVICTILGIIAIGLGM